MTCIQSGLTQSVVKPGIDHKGDMKDATSWMKAVCDSLARLHGATGDKSLYVCLEAVHLKGTHA
eukprot:5887970-Amphidinium_carterae.1